MTTIALTYNENNSIAQKAVDLLLSLGVFEISETATSAQRKTLKAIKDAREGRNLTRCTSFDEYLKAVAE